VVALVLLGPARAETADPSRLAASFNTVCAACHEGQCSGRLSFTSGKEVARTHVSRHLPGLTAPDQDLLFDLLARVKQRCELSPPAVEPPPDGRWEGARLARLRDLAGTGYFLPLGELEAGRHQLGVRSAAPRCLRLQVITADFETAYERDCAGPAVDLPAELPITAPAVCYLRVTAPEPVELVEVTLVRLADGR
jgi:hypothetical protein